jgi:hypothetical protein
MQTLAFICCELQAAQQCLRETFVELQVPAKAGMALSLFRRRRIYELIKNGLAPIIAVGMVSTAPANDFHDFIAEGYPWVKNRHVQPTIEINLVTKEQLSTNVTKKLGGYVALLTGVSHSIGSALAKRLPTS